MRKIILAGALIALFGSQALACPLCNTETGQSVRAAILDTSFVENVLYMLLPFLVFALIVIGINIRWSSFKLTQLIDVSKWGKRWRVQSDR